MSDRDDELDRLRDELRKTEERLRALDESLATLSHKLRTPLAAIVSWGSVLRDWKVEADVTQEGVAAIIESAQSMARLIDELMETSRPPSEKPRHD